MDRHYLFRGDDAYRDGPIGLVLGEEADGADIQDFAEHVLRKETRRTSRYVSFSEEIKIARRFTSAEDDRHVRKVALDRLRELEAQGVIGVWDPDRVFAALKEGPQKLARKAQDVRNAMRRNREILIEGQVPAEIVAQAD